MSHQTTKIISLVFLSVFLLGACVPADQITTGFSIATSVVTQDIPNTDDVLEDVDDTEIQEGSSNSTDPSPPSQIPDSSDLQTNSSTNALTEDEIASLMFMREEEKLALDVYQGLYDLWGLSIFQNIAQSEQTHTDAVKRLLDIYDIEDPAEPSPTGTFVNVELQELYDELMALGAQSLSDALKVGGAIEEIDILDLQAYLENTQNSDVRRVYENLLRGSENHLRAFTSTLERQTGEIYQPQYLTQADYDVILTSNISRGRGRRGNRP